jgi:hypothetical protein
MVRPVLHVSSSELVKLYRKVLILGIDIKIIQEI